jgi:transcription termination factor NusB
MNTKTEKDKNVLEEFERCGYSYMHRLFERWKHRAYFNDAAKARLGCILGYILGLKHSGQTEFAEKLAEDIDEQLDQLSFKHNQLEINEKSTDDDGNEKTITVKVPMRKCLVGDDGTWHGFTLVWYSLLNSDVYDEHFQQARDEISKSHEKLDELDKKLKKTKNWDDKQAIERQIRDATIYESAHQLVVKKLGILERSDPNAQYSEELTEYRYINGVQRRFYYVPGFNGGLIYHGPGAGETFTVNLGSGTLWGIHT